MHMQPRLYMYGHNGVQGSGFESRTVSVGTDLGHCGWLQILHRGVGVTGRTAAD